MRLAAFLALIALAPAAAYSTGCAFNISQAIVCTTPLAAAISFQEFSPNPEEAATSYNNALLHRAGCGGTAVMGGQELLLRQEGRVPTRQGWVDVAMVGPEQGPFMWTAKGYLSGVCKRERHPTLN